jgi:hypothetical protein
MLRFTPKPHQRIVMKLVLHDEDGAKGWLAGEFLKDGVTNLIADVIEKCTTETAKKETRQTIFEINVVVIPPSELEEMIQTAYNEGLHDARRLPKAPCGICDGAGWAAADRPSAVCPACDGSGRRP